MASDDRSNSLVAGVQAAGRWKALRKCVKNESVLFVGANVRMLTAGGGALSPLAQWCCAHLDALEQGSARRRYQSLFRSVIRNCPVGVRL